MLLFLNVCTFASLIYSVSNWPDKGACNCVRCPAGHWKSQMNDTCSFLDWKSWPNVHMSSMDLDCRSFQSRIEQKHPVGWNLSSRVLYRQRPYSLFTDDDFAKVEGTFIQGPFSSSYFVPRTSNLLRPASDTIHILLGQNQITLWFLISMDLVLTSHLVPACNLNKLLFCSSTPKLLHKYMY
jgi:hypothetical protein